MSASQDHLTIEQALAAIERMRRESDKFVAERDKLLAERAKLDRDRMVVPVQLAIALVTAGGVLVGATIALMKTIGGP